MKKIILPVFLMLAFLTGIVTAQTPEPTQTPYIIYVVVTATPEPAPVAEQQEETEPVISRPAPVVQPQTEAEDMIARPTPVEPITLINNASTGTSETGGEVTIVNSATYAGTVEDLVQRVVATVSAGMTTSTVAGGTQDNSGAGGALVHLADGTTCTMNFQLVSEPTYPAGAIIPRGEVFWKEWVIQNTGTCTWTPEWEFIFDSGWQIGNTRFHMNRTTAPGGTLNVRLAMVPDQKADGNYYSTYVFEAPDGTQYGTITSSYTVKPYSYFAKPTPKPQDRNKPPHHEGPGPRDRKDPGPCGPGWCPPPPPRW